MALVADRPFLFAGRRQERGSPVRGENGELPKGKVYGQVVTRGWAHEDPTVVVEGPTPDYVGRTYGQEPPPSVVVWVDEGATDPQTGEPIVVDAAIGDPEPEAGGSYDEDAEGEPDPKRTPPGNARRPRRATR